MEYEPCLQDGKRPSLKKLSGPDGVEAWCIALAAFVINFVMAGLGRMSGVLFVAFIEIFETDRRSASLPFSIRSSVRNLLGPVVGILGQKYGVRKVTVVGGIIGTISAAACFYANDILWVTIVWGFFNGIGTSLTTTLPQVTIGQHFEKYQSTASGMAFSGGCLGSFIFPALMEYLLHKYGLGGTFLLIAGIIMNTIPASLVLREPTWMKKRKSIQIVTMSNGISHDEKAIEQYDGNIPSERSNVDYNNSIETLNGELYNTRKQIGTKISGNLTADVHFLLQNKEIVTKVLMDDFETQNSFQEMNVNKLYDLYKQDIEKLCFDIERYQSNVNCELIERSDFTESYLVNKSNPPNGTQNIGESSNIFNKISDPNYLLNIDSHILVWPALERIARSDVKDVLSLFPHEDHENISKVIGEIRNVYLILEHYRNNSKSLPFSTPPVAAISTREMNSEEYERSNTFMEHIKTALRLHTKPMFLLICLCRTIHYMSFFPVVTTVVDFSMDKGLPEEDGKYVIASLSAGDLLGRLCTGWITDNEWISVPRFIVVTMIVLSAATICVPFLESREGIMIGFAVYGLLQGSVFVRHPVLVAKYLGSDEQSIAMGSINFFPGIIGLILPTYIGYFRDTVGAYDCIYYINGGLTAAVGFTWIFESFLFRNAEEDEIQGPSEV